MSRAAAPVYTAQYEYQPRGDWYRWNGYEEYLTGVEAFLYRGTIWMHRKEENPEEIANKEIWDLLGFPRATGNFISEEKSGINHHEDAAQPLEQGNTFTQGIISWKPTQKTKSR